MSKTKHLDTAIAILKGAGGAKRAPRKADVTITITLGTGCYTLQSNGRIVEEGEGDADYANSRANDRARAVRALGKTCLVVTE